MTIRSTDDVVAVENPFRVLKVNLVVAQIAIAFLRIPIEPADARHQPLKVFRHSDPPPDGGCDTCSTGEGSL
jgi:hypothetical protein